MKIVKMETHMLSQKVIANVTPEFARVYNIPEGHTSVGFFSADNDDIGYLAVDDASKKANIKLIHAETYYGGTTCSWSKYGGSVFVLFSGPKVEDVKSGLRYVRDFIENHSELCNFDGDEGTAFYAQTIPRPGKYFQEWCELKPGESYAYLVGGPIETNYALDKALRVEELTNQFFEITRYNLNDIPLNKTNIDLVMLLDQLVEEFYPMLEERNLKLNITKPNILMYNADGDKLARAFGNLLKNAISYSYENTTITINMIENEENIEITFKNKGATIPEYKLERIFDKFYRADESRQTNNGGAGLGLAITKEIIELHNGKICAKSNDEFIEFQIELKK